MNKYLGYIVGLVVTLLALLGYNIQKRKSAEALLDNVKALEEFKELDKKIARNEGLSEAEEVKRLELKAELAKELAKKGATNAEIDDFLNDRYNA